MTLEVAVLDYGAGNLHSLAKALEAAGAKVRVATDARDVVEAPAIVLPGVGAFGAAADGLRPFREELLGQLEAGKPFLGICLGMQLLFERSEESPGAAGLGYVRGGVERLKHAKLPQIGWNPLVFEKDPIFEGLRDGEHVYYVNSYAPAPREPATIGTSTYGSTFTAVIRKRNAYGTQFHPEKSSKAGLTMIQNWVRIAEENA